MAMRGAKVTDLGTKVSDLGTKVTNFGTKVTDPSLRPRILDEPCGLLLPAAALVPMVEAGECGDVGTRVRPRSDGACLGRA